MLWPESASGRSSTQRETCDMHGADDNNTNHMLYFIVVVTVVN